MGDNDPRNVIRTVISYVWKLPLCAIGYAAGAAIGGALVTGLGLTLPEVPAGADPETLQVYSLLAALLLALGLAPLSRWIQGGYATRWLILALFTYLCGVVSIAIEAAIFTDLGGMGAMPVIFLPSCVLFGGIAAALFRPRDRGDAFGLSLRRFFSQRTTGAWLWRIGAAWLAFPLIYWAFGSAISPLVMDYYREGAFGLTLPGVDVILGVQLVRSALFLLASLPVLIAWSGSRRGLALALGLAHFVLVGLYGLVQSNWMPLSLRLVHGTEILADSMVYASVLVLLLTARRDHEVATDPGYLGTPTERRMEA